MVTAQEAKNLRCIRMFLIHGTGVGSSVKHTCCTMHADVSLTICQVIIIFSSQYTHICIRIYLYPKKYAHGFVVLCFVVVMESFIMDLHEVFIHIHQGCFAGTGAIVRLPQCQWSKPDGYGKISQCITTTKQSKAKTVCIFLGIYCMYKDSIFCQRPPVHTHPHPTPKPNPHPSPNPNPPQHPAPKYQV